MSRTSRFLRGLSLGYVNMGLALVVGLWLTPFLLSHIGRNDYGVWLIVAQLLMYLSLIDLGVVALLPRETAYAVGRAGSTGETGGVAEVVGRTGRVVLWQTPVLALVCALLWIWTPIELAEHRGLFLLILVIYVARFPLRIFQEVLLGLQDLAFIGKLQLTFFIVSTLVTVVTVLAGWGLYAIVAGFAVVQFCPPLSCWARLASRFPDALPRRLPSIPVRDVVRLVSQGGWISAAQIAQLLVFSTDILVIGWILGPAAVVPYSCTGKLISVLSNQPHLIAEMARPALSELKAGNSLPALYRASSALTRTVLLLSGAIACGVLVVNEGFTVWWVGADLYGGFELTLLLVISMVLRHWNTTTVFAIFCFGYERRICLTTLADGLVNVCLSYVLVGQLGVIGAPIASTISVLLVSLPWNLAAFARECGVSIFGAVASTAPWFWRFACVFGIGIAFAVSFARGSLVHAVIAASAIMALYAGFMLPLAFKQPLVDYVRPRFDLLRMRMSALRSNDVT